MYSVSSGVEAHNSFAYTVNFQVLIHVVYSTRASMRKAQQPNEEIVVIAFDERTIVLSLPL